METKQTEITIPLELASEFLSLEEIGAIVVLMSSLYLEGSTWSKNEKFIQCLKKLKEDGIIKSIKTENEIKLEVDLTWL